MHPVNFLTITSSQTWLALYAPICRLICAQPHGCPITGIQFEQLYSAANDPRPQMIARPEMIPTLDRKLSRTANDPRYGPQMIPAGK